MFDGRLTAKLRLSATLAGALAATSACATSGGSQPAPAVVMDTRAHTIPSTTAQERGTEAAPPIEPPPGEKDSSVANAAAQQPTAPAPAGGPGHDSLSGYYSEKLVESQPRIDIRAEHNRRGLSREAMPG